MSEINGQAAAVFNSGNQDPSLRAHAGTPHTVGSNDTKHLVKLLEIPFEPAVIEWRVTNTTKGDDHNGVRGQVIPYADQRAYTDRLNQLFTPAGWTRKYAVHTSANFERSKDQKTIAKVFVTCELTIFGLGMHSATGEEWADDENAGTSAEAQAFKRACSCFGLGRYLYYFTGTWVDLDERKRPKMKPKLAGWATPEGWKQGLRPGGHDNQHSRNECAQSERSQGDPVPGDKEDGALIPQIEAMAIPLGKGLYRGLLKSVAKVWQPGEITDAKVRKQVLEHMQAAQRGLKRLEIALGKTGPEALVVILRSLNLSSLDRVETLERLHKVVRSLEVKAESVAGAKTPSANSDLKNSNKG